MRFAFGGIHIECSTYSRIRSRTEDFTALSGEELSAAPKFAFLRSYSHPLLSHALRERGARRAGGRTVRILQSQLSSVIEVTTSARRTVSANARRALCRRDARCRRRLDLSHAPGCGR